MSHNTSHLLLACVRCAIEGKPLPKKAAEGARENLPELYSLSKHHDLSHLLFDVLRDGEVIQKGDEYYNKFEKQKLTAIYRSMKLESELSRIKATLSESKIRHIPLKGAIIRKLYPAPYMRTSCDIDILVSEETLDDAISILTERLSYTTDGVRHFHDVSLYSPSGIHLELHFSILEKEEKLDKVLSKVFEYTVPSEESYSLKLDNEFLIFHLLAHTCYHFLNGGSGIKPFIDLRFLITALDFSREKLDLLCKEAEIEKFCAACECLTRVWFFGEEHSDLTRKMEDFIIRGGVYGSHDNKNAIEQNKAGGKLRHIRSLIFPSFSTMKVMYPVLERHSILLPICHIRRWCRIIFTGKIKRSVRIIKSNASVTEEERQNLGELFEMLEL